MAPKVSPDKKTAGAKSAAKKGDAPAAKKEKEPKVEPSPAPVAAVDVSEPPAPPAPAPEPAKEKEPIKEKKPAPTKGASPEKKTGAGTKSAPASKAKAGSSSSTPPPKEKASPAPVAAVDVSDPPPPAPPAPAPEPTKERESPTKGASPEKKAGAGTKSAPASKAKAGSSSSTPPPKEKAGGAKGSSGKGGAVAKGGKKGGVAEEAAALLTSSELHAAVEKLLALADETDKASSGVFESFEFKLGSAIIKRVEQLGKLEDMIKEWDSNGDGDISKIEFRQCVRSKLKMDIKENKDIDAFFAKKLDEDGGGSLSLAELKPALKKLKEESAAAADAEKGVKAKAVAMRAKAAATKEVAEATAVMEKEEARLHELENSTTVRAKLGAAIVKKNLKIAEVMTKWDADGDGTVDKKEFVKNVKEMGVVAESAEIVALFDEVR